MDMKGVVQLVEGNLMIQNGEAKTSLTALRKAREQLQLSIKVSQWVVSHIVDDPITSSVLVSHLFVPKSEKKKSKIKPDIKNEVSLFTHYI